MDKTILVTTILLILIFTTSICYAETLHGRVYNTREGTLGSHMLVALNTTPVRTTYTDEEGFYYFKDIEPGVYLVRLYRDTKLDNHDKNHWDKLKPEMHNGKIPIIARLIVYKGRTTLHNFNLSKIGHPHADDDY